MIADATKAVRAAMQQRIDIQMCCPGMSPKAVDLWLRFMVTEHNDGGHHWMDQLLIIDDDDLRIKMYHYAKVRPQVQVMLMDDGHTTLKMLQAKLEE